MQTKMWCVCRKKDGKPLEIMIDEEATAGAIGFSTRKSLMKAAGVVEDDEIVKKIIFDY